MSGYLLDTNICIYYMKGMYGLDMRVERADADNLFISEITVAELKFGVENSEKKAKNQKALDRFLEGVQILPIYSCLDIYAKEKARQRKAGIVTDEFDMLIAATAVANQLTMVTRNVKHFSHFQGLTIEDWTSQ